MRRLLTIVFPDTVTILSYPVHIFPSGEVTPISDWSGGKAEAKIVIETLGEDRRPDPAKILPNGKTAIDDFLDYYRNQPPTSLTDEEIDQLRHEAMKEKYSL